jgi:hypothetical protein
MHRSIQSASVAGHQAKHARPNGRFGRDRMRTPRGYGPSRRSLMDAWELGQKLARQERRLRPVLHLATQFSSYEDFSLAHRFAIENTPLFPAWEERIQKLAESEGNRIGFDLDKSIQLWDEFYTYIFTPIKHAFWLGWEESWKLESTYKQMRSSHAQGKKVLAKAAHSSRPATAPPTLPPVSVEKLSEEDRWDAVAEKLFDDLGGDKNETLWDMPEAVSAGAKANVGQT